MAGAGRRAGRGFLLHPNRPASLRAHKGILAAHSSTTTELPLEWSFALASSIAVSTVTGDEEDAWTVPLEWSFLIDLDPPDDVEGDP